MKMRFPRAPRARRPVRIPAAADDRLSDLGAIRNNPGNLSGRVFVPAAVKGPMPLVVVLHGCTQDAATYDRGSGWSTLAEREGFALLFPEQSAPTIRCSASTGSRGMTASAAWARRRRSSRDDRCDAQGARHRRGPDLRHRPVGGRRHGVSDARHLSRDVRGRRDHRRRRLWLRVRRRRGVRLHGRPRAERRRRARRPCPPRLAAQGAVAASPDLAGQRRHDGNARQCRRDRAAMGVAAGDRPQAGPGRPGPLSRGGPGWARTERR